MADISFTNLTNLPPDIATELENINRKRRIQDALMAQTLQQGQTQMTGGKYSRAVPYSPLEGATKLIQAAMLSKQSDKNNEALRGLGQRYENSFQPEYQDVMSTLKGRKAAPAVYNEGQMGTGPTVPGFKPDPVGAVTQAVGSSDPRMQRVGDTLMDMQQMDRSKDRGSYFSTVPTRDGKLMLLNNRTGEIVDTGKYAAKYDVPTTESLAGAKTTGTGMAERQLDKPSEQAGVEAQQRKQVFVSDLIKEAKEDSGFFTAGFIGKIGSFVPGTPQYNLSEKLATIKANLGFDKLQEMRDASKTGGALGQISNREIDFLQAVWSSVEQGQSPGELDKNLTRVDAAIEAVVDGKVDKYNRLYPDDQYPTNGGKGDDELFNEADRILGL